MSEISTVIMSSLANAISDRLAQRLLPIDPGVTALDGSAARGSIENCLKTTAKWASEISFRDLIKSKAFKNSFVDLDLMLGHPHLQTKEPMRLIKVSDLLLMEKNFIVVGDPGAGKTTSLKRIALGMLRGPSEANFSFPLLLRMRDHPDARSLSELILSKLGISVAISPDYRSSEKEDLQRRLVLRYIDEQGCLILIDGLDELPPKARDRIVRELRKYLLESKRVRFIITCRTGEWVYHLENATLMAIRSLTNPQINEFAKRWLGDTKARNFLEQIRRTPYSGSEVRPLTLAHLCAIYERSGSIPEKPRTVYRKIVRLLIEDWDLERTVKRTSRYPRFEPDRKEDFLQALAYRLTLTDRSQFSREQVDAVYRKIHLSFGLPADEARYVFREIEAHTGIFVESAFENFEFSHKALQEYLTAEFALKFPHPPYELYRNFPNESALVIALSANPNAYFHTLIDYLGEYGANFPVEASLIDPLVRRLVVEGVEFVRSVELGNDILRLASPTYTTPSGWSDRTDRNRFNRDPVPFASLTRMPEVHESIKAALKQSRVVPVAGASLVEVNAYGGSSKVLREKDTLLIQSDVMQVFKGIGL